jgi:outer membrane cobalamin receptor
MRYFHNLYGQFALTEQLSVMTGFDIGAEQKAHNSGDYNVWFTPVVIAKYRFTDQFSAAFRAEYYQDKDGVIIDSGTPNGFRTSSYSANVDYRFSNQVMLRAELRKYRGRDDYFLNNDQPSRDSLVGTTAFILSF